MIQAAICTIEAPVGCKNRLNEVHNLNYQLDWVKNTGALNANIFSDTLGRNSFFGIGCMNVHFLDVNEVSFSTSGNILAEGTQLRNIVQKSGEYILSYGLKKNDTSSSISFIVEVYVNNVLIESRRIYQLLDSANGFIDGIWNIYYQVFNFNYGDKIDFNFKAQSNIPNVDIYFDRMQMILNDRGFNQPTLYFESDIEEIAEENQFNSVTINANDSLTLTLELTGAKINTERKYIAIDYPEDFINKSILVGEPKLVSDNVVKVILYNTSNSSKTLEDGVINLKVIR